ncbi:hypothetical protein F1559_000848 [Cyanidiococcus yangmingshanensis]|uniref:VTT domain-containing protein n=1 Tax=Cyanidiococcus yangmingshanensis TaxID=2690220 RepID=A0A7J7IM29_9RHOD|nr:hypothetical protein F1559_000848 [Cyanidiococcus yangmingshanensis]
MKSGTESDSVLHRRTRSGSAQSALEKDATWKRPNLEDASCLVRSRSLSKTELHERCGSFKNLAVLNMSTDGMARAAVSSEDAVHVPLRRAAVDHVGVNIPTAQAAGGASNQTECRNSRSSERTTSVWVLATAGIAVLALGVTLLILHKQVSRAFSIAVAWMRRLPWPIRLLSYATMYIILAALEFPAWLMAIGAGMLFGLVSGIGLALACHLAAAILCLYTSRYFLRERMERLIETSARRNTYLAVNRALSRQALRFITLMRLSPAFPLRPLFHGHGCFPSANRLVLCRHHPRYPTWYHSAGEYRCATAMVDDPGGTRRCGRRRRSRCCALATSRSQNCFTRT